MRPLKSHPEGLEVESRSALAHALLSPHDMLLHSPYHSALQVQMISQALCWEMGGTLWSRFSSMSPACSPAPYISSLPSSNLNKHLFSAGALPGTEDTERPCPQEAHSFVGMWELLNINPARAFLSPPNMVRVFPVVRALTEVNKERELLRPPQEQGTQHNFFQGDSLL